MGRGDLACETDSGTKPPRLANGRTAPSRGARLVFLRYDYSSFKNVKVWGDPLR